jgi:benzoate-CoA ligase
MPVAFSSVELSHSPPHLAIPREFNAAFDLLDRHVLEGRGQRVAIIDDTGRWTYQAVSERANRTGNALLTRGIEPEQRVLLALLDTVDFPATFLGAMKAGLVPVPVNTLLSPEDYVYLLRDSRARALVVSDTLLPKLLPAIEAAPLLRTVLVARTPLGGDRGKFEALEDAQANALPTLSPFESTSDDVAFWLYSSGSTGKPKGALHLHGSLLHTAALYARGVLGLRPDDVVFSAAKLFFAYGLGNSLTFPFSVGATAVLMAERPTPTAVMATMRAHQPTVFCGVPTLFAQILAEPTHDREAGSASLRVSTSAGEALPQHVGERWRERFGTDILDGIGSTEMLHIFISNRAGEIRYGTTGRVVPGYELKLLDDDGELAPDGSEGSLWVRGPSACVGYWNDRVRSLATFHGPWARTGDRYIRDEHGYWTYCGRADDMLKVGGIWVSPFEVESALAAHPQVLEAAVVGHADDDGLIKPKAYVVLKSRAGGNESLVNELKAFVKSRLAPFKYPRWIEFLDELPKTATGKIQRFKLRA